MPVHPSVPGLRLQRLLGEGACGRVYEAVGAEGAVWAVKFLVPESVNFAYVTYCLGKMAGEAGHPSVAPVVDCRTDETTGVVVYGMPLYADEDGDDRRLHGRSLERYVGVVAGEEAWPWVLDMAQGLAHLHLHAVVHGNFKTSNVFIDLGTERARAVVTDFGQGWIGGVEALPLTDHALFAPPEQLRQPTQIQFGLGERWDVYAFGVTAFRLLTGRFPRGQEWAPDARAGAALIDLPDPDECAARVELASSVEWPLPPANDLEAARRQVVEKCLQLDPTARWIDMREVRDALEAIDREAEAQAAWASWEVERAQWHAAAGEAGGSPALPITDPPSDAAARRIRRSATAAPWLGWAAGLAATAAAVLGGWLVLERTALRGARSLATQQAADLARLTTESADRLDERDQALAEARVAMEAALAASRRSDANLASSQAAAEQFFGSFLEAAAQLPADSERARLLLAGYEHFSEFLASHSDRPELAESLLLARCHLAEVKRALGSTREAADKFDDARHHLQAFLAAHPDHPQASELRLRAADCLLQAGRLRLEAGPAAPAASEALAQALAEIEAASEATGNPPELQRRVADGEMMLAEAELARVSADLRRATVRVQHAADLTHHLLADPRLSQPGDKIRLGRALLLRGRLERRAGDTEPALATQVEAAQTLLECGDQPEALDLLAQCYGETGTMLHANGEAHDAVRAHGEAVKILSDLVKSDPTRPDLRLALAARYGDLAQLLRENGQAPRALDYQRGAVEILQALLSRDVANITIATTLARLRADLCDLLASLGQKSDALVQASEALALLDRINLPGPPATTIDLSQRVAVARSYGVVGEVAEAAKQIAQAKSCFEKSVTHYETAAAASPRDGTIDRGLTESRMRLARLHP